MIVLLYLARPATLFTNLDPRTNLEGLLLYLLPCLVLIRKHQITFGTKFLAIIGVFSSWVGIHYFVDEDFKLLSYLLTYTHILVAYVLVRVFHSEIFFYFWRVVAALTVLDLVGWGLVHFVDLSTMESISLLEPASDTSSASFLLFNSPGIRYEGMGLLGLLRNCGFAWEPGLYGSILVMATFFNLAEKEYEFKNNLGLYILLLGIFTTFSTTAYTAVLVLFTVRMLIAMRQEVTFNRFVGICTLVGSILIANNLPFMNEKIQEDTNLENTLSGNKKNLKQVQKERETRTVKRTEGLALDYLNYKESPTWGYGIDPVNSFVHRKISPYLITSNDLTSFLAKWGLIYTILLVFLFIWNSRFIRNYVLYDDNSFLCVYLIVAVSYSLSLCALAICLLLYRFLEEEEEIDFLIDYEYEAEEDEEFDKEEEYPIEQ